MDIGPVAMDQEFGFSAGKRQRGDGDVYGPNKRLPTLPNAPKKVGKKAKGGGLGLGTGERITFEEWFATSFPNSDEFVRNAPKSGPFAGKEPTKTVMKDGRLIRFPKFRVSSLARKLLSTKKGRERYGRAFQRVLVPGSTSITDVDAMNALTLYQRARDEKWAIVMAKNRAKRRYDGIAKGRRPHVQRPKLYSS